MSLHKVISKTHPPISLPKRSWVSWAAAASWCLGPLQGPETRQNPAQPSYPGHPCPAYSPWDKMLTPKMPNPACQPLIHAPSGILCPQKNTADATSPPGQLWLPQATASCGLQHKRGLMLSLPEHSRSHVKLHLSGKTQGQTTAAHNLWADTMHS